MSDTIVDRIKPFERGGGAAVVTAAAPLAWDAATNTVSFGTVAANRVMAGPTGGGAAAPGFRVLGAADVPA